MRCLVHLLEGSEFPELHHSVTVVLLICMFLLLSSCNVSVSYPEFYIECSRSLTWTRIAQAYTYVALWNKYC